MIDIIKSLPELAGVYKITSPTGKIYIGESHNLKQRCKNYLYPNKIKKQRAIYNSLILHGVDSHNIEILEFCDLLELKEKERYYQDYYDSVNNGLNCFLTKTDTQTKKHSLETKKIMSDKSKGDKNPFYGKKHSEETLKKISDSSKGENNPNYGGKFKNDEWLKKQSVSNSKTPLLVIDTLTGEEIKFINSKECADYLNTKPGSIRTSKKYGCKIKKRFLIKDTI
jgi:group I intron endonuclease